MKDNPMPCLLQLMSGEGIRAEEMNEGFIFVRIEEQTTNDGSYTEKIRTSHKTDNN